MPGYFKKYGEHPKFKGWRHKHIARLPGCICQRQRDFYIGEQTQVCVLLTRADDEHQPVIFFQVALDIKPVQIFEAHTEYPSTTGVEDRLP